MGVRGFFQKIILIAVTFCVSYVVNAFLIFSHQPQPFGEYTGLGVTIIAFLVSIVILVFGGKK